MNVQNEKITNKVVEIFSDVITQLTNTCVKDDLILNGPVGGSRSMLGMKISKVKFFGNEYYLKANRYLLIIILKFLIENNKIDLDKKLPLIIQSTDKRYLLNSKPIHAEDYKMRDILVLKSDEKKLYIESKLNTNNIHNACYRLLKRYKIPVEVLEVQYSKKRRKIADKYLNELKKQGYCLVEDNTYSMNIDQVA